MIFKMQEDRLEKDCRAYDIKRRWSPVLHTREVKWRLYDHQFGMFEFIYPVPGAESGVLLSETRSISKLCGNQSYQLDQCLFVFSTKYFQTFVVTLSPSLCFLAAQTCTLLWGKKVYLGEKREMIFRKHGYHTRTI